MSSRLSRGTMKTRTIQSLSETWQPEPAEIPAWKTLVKEGRNLPNSLTEDIGGFSLMPRYSVEQLRRIDRKQKHKNRCISKTAKKEWRMAKRW